MLASIRIELKHPKMAVIIAAIKKIASVDLTAMESSSWQRIVKKEPFQQIATLLSFLGNDGKQSVGQPFARFFS